MKVPDYVFRCDNCGGEGETSYPDGQGGQAPICGPCELLLICNNGGDVPLWVAP